MDAERVAHRVHNLCSTIEALGQELQDAEAEIQGLREALGVFIEAEYSADARGLEHPITIGLLSRAAELAHAVLKGDGDG